MRQGQGCTRQAMGFGSNLTRFPTLTSRMAVGHLPQEVDSKFVLTESMADGLKTRLRHKAVTVAHPTSKTGTFPHAERTTVVLPKSLAEDLPGYSYYLHAQRESQKSWKKWEGRTGFDKSPRSFDEPKTSRKHFLPPVATYNLENTADIRSAYRNRCGTKRAYKATRAPFNSTQPRMDL
eukprot:m.454008 g.454008  ORF g.454008 m.454008 type:complete len:179 (-) comp20597_c0_seq1:199-735(-)